MKKILIFFGFFGGDLILKLITIIPTCKMFVYSGALCRKLNIVDKHNFSSEYPSYYSGHKYINIVSGHIRKYARISAIDNYNGFKYTPSINIGNNVNIGVNTHIGVIGHLVIGDNFLTGANCLITDHTHGNGGGK